LTALEESGRLRRGYFVDGLGGAQFAHPEAVELLREQLRAPRPADTVSGPAVILAAVDPANPYGAALPWPTRMTSDPVPAPRNAPGRRVGALVVLLEGDLVLHLDRTGRSVSSWTTSADALAAAARGLADLVHRGSITSLTLRQVDGVPLLRADHPLAQALAEAGFHATPRGFRLR
jgi:ATP-dependent Lhr-like helicase